MPRTSVWPKRAAGAQSIIRSHRSIEVARYAQSLVVGVRPMLRLLYTFAPRSRALGPADHPRTDPLGRPAVKASYTLTRVALARVDEFAKDFDAMRDKAQTDREVDFWQLADMLRGDYVRPIHSEDCHEPSEGEGAVVRRVAPRREHLEGRSRGKRDRRRAARNVRIVKSRHFAVQRR